MRSQGFGPILSSYYESRTFGLSSRLAQLEDDIRAIIREADGTGRPWEALEKIEALLQPPASECRCRHRNGCGVLCEGKAVVEVATGNLLGEGRSLGMHCQPCADTVTDAINAAADGATASGS